MVTGYRTNTASFALTISVSSLEAANISINRNVDMIFDGYHCNSSWLNSSELSLNNDDMDTFKILAIAIISISDAGLLPLSTLAILVLSIFSPRS